MAVYYNDEGDLKLLAGSTMYADNPIGSILPYGGITAPNGWFLCQGQALSRIEYADLFKAIGTNFGVGDGSTTFNIPDLRGEFLRGAGTNSHTGEGSGGTVGTHQGATKVPSIITRQNNIATANFSDPTVNNAVENADYGTLLPTPNGVGVDCVFQGQVYSTSLNSIKYTTRPTNTSVNYIIKAKHIPVPADFTDSLVGYLGQETNYNLYSWSHVKSDEGVDINQDITIERNGWYSIDYTMTSNTNVQHTFTLRDFDALGEVHTIMRFMYDKSGTFRQTFLVPLKAGTYRYSHGGVGTLSVYMNRRDFA